MAKRILYKVTAYHCPKCGGITEPSKKYCEYCERELLLQRYEGKRNVKSRFLIYCANDYVYFNEILQLESDRHEPQIIDTTTLDDYYMHHRAGIQEPPKFEIELPFNARGRELFSLIDFRKSYKMRIEMQLGNGLGTAWDVDSFINSVVSEIRPHEMITQRISLIGMTDLKESENLIPMDILENLRCPNCGAPIKSQYGACDYCGGWNVVDW